MKSYTLLLAIIFSLFLVCPSFGVRAPKVKTDKEVVMKATVSDQDRELTKMKAYKVAAEELGENADDVAMLRRVEEITDKLLREAFPDAYVPAPKKKLFSHSDDIWENGTVVRYLARGLLLMLGVGLLWAHMDKKPLPTQDRTKFIRATPAAESTRSASISRKTK